ncbi:Protein of unknown function [Belnapia rosea]|nr:Protein of unknown function [Belnapia rosea]
MTRATTQKAAQAPAPTIVAIPPADVLGRLAALQAAPIAHLKQQWRELFGKEPPPFNRAYIQSRLAYRIQELAYGGLKPETRARLEALGEQLDGGNVVLRRIRADSWPLPGTQLIREYAASSMWSPSAATTSSTKAGLTGPSPPSPGTSPARARMAGPSSG